MECEQRDPRTTFFVEASYGFSNSRHLYVHTNCAV